MICDTLITTEERASHVKECCLGKAVLAFPQLGVVLLGTQQQARRSPALLRQKSRNKWSLSPWEIPVWEITMIIMGVPWFPVELNYFFPFHFNVKAVTPLAASAADRKTGAFSKEHFLSLGAQDVKANSDNICHFECATKIFQCLKWE